MIRNVECYLMQGEDVLNVCKGCTYNSSIVNRLHAVLNNFVVE